MWRCVSLQRNFHYEVFFYTIVDETCSAPDVVLVAIVTGDLVHSVPSKA